MDGAYFCHGAPGSIRDVELVKLHKAVENIYPIDLFKNADIGDAPIQSALNHFDHATSNITDNSVHLVGFSLGAMYAVHIAATRPHKVGKLTLISSAAPLQLGEFLPNMAGKQVFKLAQKNLALLTILTRIQGAIFKTAPNILAHQLFSTCDPQERALLNDPHFKSVLFDGFTNSLLQHSTAYINSIKHYVSDWSDCLEQITCPVSIWHGSSDTWAPVEMAHALRSVFTNHVDLNIIDGAGHYSTLLQYGREG